ncbi:hypothetical protein IKP85_06145 [bacterium]|nr:hypothetical protein [bacterium]
MIPKINSYNPNNRTRYTAAQYNPYFGAKSIMRYDGYYTGGNKFATGIKNLWVSVKNFFGSFYKVSTETPKEIRQNNEFIAEIQKKLDGKRLPLGEFNTQSGNNMIISRLENGNTKLEIRTKEDNEFLRSVIVDKNNTVLKYKTSYPWRIFIKTDEGYRSVPNVDEYIKEIASDPMNLPYLIPRP